MKKFLLIPLVLCFISGSATVVKVGSGGYVTVDGQNYARRMCATYYLTKRNGDTTLQLSLPGYGTIAGQTYSNFLDGDNGNAAFTSMAAVKAWMDSHFEAVPDTIVSGGGSTITCDSFSISGDDNTVEFSYSMTAGYRPISADIITSQNDNGRPFARKKDHHWSGTTFYIDIEWWDGVASSNLPSGTSRTIQVCYLH